MDVIDLNAERSKREQPDPQFVRQDDFGRPLYEFLLSYRMDEKSWSITVWAYSFEDAGNRVAAMRESLKLDGQLYGRVPA